jgi:hypothetical protein
MREIQVRLIDPTNVIVKKILQGIVEDYNKLIIKVLPSMEARVREGTKAFFIKSDFYPALAGGELEGHFGFPKGTGVARIKSIIEAIANAMVVRNTPIRLSGKNFFGKLEIKVLRTDLNEIFSLPSNVTEVRNYSNRTKSGDEDYEILPWVEWWLKRGGDIIISQYEISFETNAPGSRSGQAIMVSNDAGIWRVPNEYAGTIGDNSLTRALLGRKNEYLAMLGSIIKSEIGKP